MHHRLFSDDAAVCEGQGVFFSFFFSGSHRVRFSLSHQCHLSLFSSKSQITPLRDTHTHTHRVLISPFVHQLLYAWLQGRCLALCNAH